MTWPQRANGTNKAFGEMTIEEKRAAIASAVRRVKTVLETPEVADLLSEPAAAVVQDDPLTVMRETLADIKSMTHGYGFKLTAKEHPWYETAARLERAIANHEAAVTLAKYASESAEMIKRAAGWHECALHAADYYISRLEAAQSGKVVRDLDEAAEGYKCARRKYT